MQIQRSELTKPGASHIATPSPYSRPEIVSQISAALRFGLLPESEGTPTPRQLDRLFSAYRRSSIIEAVRRANREGRIASAAEIRGAPRIDLAQLHSKFVVLTGSAHDAADDPAHAICQDVAYVYRAPNIAIATICATPSPTKIVGIILGEQS